jgi:hypothetical protein
MGSIAARARWRRPTLELSESSSSSSSLPPASNDRVTREVVTFRLFVTDDSDRNENDDATDCDASGVGIEYRSKLLPWDVPASRPRGS